MVKKLWNIFISSCCSEKSFWNMEIFFYGGGRAIFLRGPLCDLLRSKMCFWSSIMMLQTEWDIFETFLTLLGRKNWFSLLDFSEKNDGFCRFKAFVNNFLYYSLYKGKLEVITHPQCGLRFFIRPLVFDLAGVEM